MVAKTAKLITPDRVKKLLDCYGANPDCWPMDEKVSALSLIQHSSELRELQQNVAGFDRMLKASDISTDIEGSSNDELLQRIIEALPEQEHKPNRQFVNKIAGKKRYFLDFNSSIGALAASIAIVAITLSIVNLNHENIKPLSSVTVTSAASGVELDNWMWEQVMGEPVDDTDEPMTMMALLELGEI